MFHQPQNEPRPRLKTIVWSVSALAVLAILLVKQTWLGGASLNAADFLAICRAAG